MLPQCERTIEFRMRAPLAEVARACIEGMAADGWRVRSDDVGGYEVLPLGLAVEIALGSLAGGYVPEASFPVIGDADWTAWCDEPYSMFRMHPQVRATVALFDDQDEGTYVIVAGACGGALFAQGHVDRRVASLTALIKDSVRPSRSARKRLGKGRRRPADGSASRGSRR